MLILPKKLNRDSQLNLVHTSSPVSKSNMKSFTSALARLTKEFPNTKFFDIERTELDLRYLSGSEDERLKQLRKALREVDWLMPIYGGTGAADIIRRLNDDDLAKFRKNRPIVNGFSDTTFLLNFLYFKIKLLTFHYYNGCGLFDDPHHRLFFDILKGEVPSFSYNEPKYEWLTDFRPAAPLEGIAIGGNISTFRDLLDICQINPRSWEDFILFIEDIEVDVEDLHRIVIALDERGIFRHIKALVIGRMDEKAFNSDYKRFNFLFGEKKERADHIFEYVLADTIQERAEANDPIYLLKVSNFGHNVKTNNMIIPIGAKTIIHPDKTIEFVGPFVE
jgi:muramoyltetrapeptide carboxypeptidase LdcA involved in peptidoglycan recycling